MTNIPTLNDAHTILNLLTTSESFQRDMNFFRKIVTQKMGLDAFDMAKISQDLRPRSYPNSSKPCIGTKSAVLAYSILDHLNSHTNLFNNWEKYLEPRDIPASCRDKLFEQIYNVLKPETDCFLYDGKSVLMDEEETKEENHLDGSVPLSPFEFGQKLLEIAQIKPEERGEILNELFKRAVRHLD
jgi:hypothetical protein